ncbi:MAG: response regulator transcription factor [Chloroflexi bacterium]|nr:response regulator transcription factor [Chloroflexota bacterium]
MPELLIIDDDGNLTELLGTFLSNRGHSIKTAPDGISGLRKMFESKPDLVILDVTMPKRDGWETIEKIREVSDVPIIMLTARDEEPDILRGFSQGADDYVTKPFSFAQLAARVEAVLSRAENKSSDVQDIIKQGDLEVNLKTHQVTRGKERIMLTPTEFKLLKTMISRPGEVVSPDELVKEVWGPQYEQEIGHVRRYIWHLRKKIEIDPENPIYIENEWGVGYRFRPQ